MSIKRNTYATEYSQSRSEKGKLKTRSAPSSAQTKVSKCRREPFQVQIQLENSENSTQEKIEHTNNMQPPNDISMIPVQFYNTHEDSVKFFTLSKGPIKERNIHRLNQAKVRTFSNISVVDQ